MLALWDDDADDAKRHHEARVLADSTDRVAWLRARSRGITATDVARLSGPAAIRGVVTEKLFGSGFTGNQFTDHGRAREPVIARWVQRNHAILPSSRLFHAYGQPLHLATPDGVAERGNGDVVLCEIKTTSKAWTSIPRSYLRQVWWQQYVLGAERTLVVWEQHDDFVPIPGPPRCEWVERDESQIHQLVGLADMVIEALRETVR
ncbi:YqaJ viral recombinase family protein [Frondihabitans sp. PhB188]|uniref:YqaJ viral recombinase family protein n=1 Tax=Frondihabitans sp. PhB188 TaxID=2485200 RepID=UPI0018F4A067|nr:YqaJ viral recombinase family protein [Frondihabitans sp. PhB188]